MSNDEVRLGAYDWLALTGATWFGSGLLPKAPGTWGSLAALPLVASLAIYLHNIFYIVAVVIITIIAIPLATRTAQLYRMHPALAKLNPHQDVSGTGMFGIVKDKEAQKKDPGLIVIDEVAGMAAAMILVPFTWAALVVAFVFFRIFDIFKIEPGRIMERIGSGTGIVLDDIVAGLYACLCTHGFLWIYAQLNLPPLP